MTDVISFSITRSQAAVTELNVNVEHALEKRNLPPAVSFAVQLVIEELTTNIVNTSVAPINQRVQALSSAFKAA